MIFVAAIRLVILAYQKKKDVMATWTAAQVEMNTTVLPELHAA